MTNPVFAVGYYSLGMTRSGKLEVVVEVRKAGQMVKNVTKYVKDKHKV